jgi:hypothetical protein
MERNNWASQNSQRVVELELIDWCSHISSCEMILKDTDTE